MKFLDKRLYIAFLQILIATNAWGQAACNVAPQTKQIIKSALCGQAAQDKIYRQYGEGCFERSVTKRLEDSAIQILLYEKCGYREFSLELREGTLRAIKFMEVLSVCVSESVSLEEIMEERMLVMKRKISSVNCTSRTRAKLEQRRPAFEAMIRQAREIDHAAIYKKLGIVIDEKGNVLDR